MAHHNSRNYVFMTALPLKKDGKRMQGNKQNIPEASRTRSEMIHCEPRAISNNPKQFFKEYAVFNFIEVALVISGV